MGQQSADDGGYRLAEVAALAELSLALGRLVAQIVTTALTAVLNFSALCKLKTLRGSVMSFDLSHVLNSPILRRRKVLPVYSKMPAWCTRRQAHSEVPKDLTRATKCAGG